MPHIHIFMQQAVVDELFTKTTTGYRVDRQTTIEDFMAQVVKSAFRRANEELSDDQVVRYDLRVTNSMPVAMCVNITVWYTPERAPQLDAIRQEVLKQLQAWAPTLNIEVHLVVVGAPEDERLSKGALRRYGP